MALRNAPILAALALYVTAGQAHEYPARCEAWTGPGRPAYAGPCTIDFGKGFEPDSLVYKVQTGALPAIEVSVSPAGCLIDGAACQLQNVRPGRLMIVGPNGPRVEFNAPTPGQ